MPICPQSNYLHFKSKLCRIYVHFSNSNIWIKLSICFSDKNAFKYNLQLEHCNVCYYYSLISFRWSNNKSNDNDIQFGKCCCLSSFHFISLKWKQIVYLIIFYGTHVASSQQIRIHNTSTHISSVRSYYLPNQNQNRVQLFCAPKQNIRDSHPLTISHTVLFNGSILRC